MQGQAFLISSDFSQLPRTSHCLQVPYDNDRASSQRRAHERQNGLRDAGKGTLRNLGCRKHCKESSTTFQISDLPCSKADQQILARNCPLAVRRTKGPEAGRPAVQPCQLCNMNPGHRCCIEFGLTVASWGSEHVAGVFRL